MDNNRAFTLVELIVVVTILAILSAIGFVSYSSYLTGVRDTNRVTQLDSMEWALVMYGTRKKLPNPDDFIEIKNNSKILARQGNLWADVLEILEYSKEWLDPMDALPFSYMLTRNKKYFQLMALLEEEDSYHASWFTQNELGRYPYVVGNKLGILMNKQGSPIQRLEVPITELNIETTLLEYIWVIDNKQVIQWNNTVIKEIEKLTSTWGKGCKIKDTIINCSTADNNSIEPIVESTWPLINQADCELAGWFWLDPLKDIFIWTKRWNWFCISPRIWDFWTVGMSWNGWWTINDWWDPTTVDDTVFANPSDGQTRKLDTLTWYKCKEIWKASEDYSLDDTIVWRMKWLDTNKANLVELQDVDWIENATPPNWHSIPALFLSDCIDGVKDLWMTMTYTHSDDTASDITYSQYNMDRTYEGTSSAELSDPIYQDRQKYLTAWAQKSGSHLPSAFSYISDNTPGWCEWIACDELSWDARWEYQVACEDSILLDSNEQDDFRMIWLSGIGDTSGAYWSQSPRMVWASGCGKQWGWRSGMNYYYLTARFIIRP